jgi:isoquinoline 1-oxidoreductase beta subunit
MYGEITVKNNSIEQNNFDQYRLVRMNESPKKIEITWIPPSPNQGPGGLGEPATAVIQGAIANAIFAATGKRVRTLPFTPENISAA